MIYYTESSIIMDNNKRACFALVVATLVNKKRYSYVFDYRQGRYISISSSNVDKRNPSFFDYNRGGAVTGDRNGMFDHVSGSHVSLSISGKNIGCFDFQTNTHLSFTVNRDSVGVFDFETNEYYQYAVS